MISLVVVNYRSASLAIEAVRSAGSASASRLHTVIVDNSSDPREAELLRPYADVLLVSDRNRGYAGAINDARRVCEGDTVVICNPDVVFAPGSIDALANALDPRTGVAGPALFWDDAHQWQLPPAELHTGLEMLSETLGSRSRGWAAARDRRRIRHRIAFWCLRDTTEVKAISGAVMAVRRSVLESLDGFDERFFLYFEENDFLRRVSARGLRIAYVPEARCRHLYNQSAGSSDDAPALYASSERRYLEKWNGPFVAQTLGRLRKPPLEPASKELGGPIPVTGQNVLIEASPLASFDTAAGHFPTTDSVDLPSDVRASYRGNTVYLRVIDRETGRVQAIYRRRVRD